MTTDKKTLQSYNQYAQRWAEGMRSGNNAAHEYLEKPAMYKLLPDLKGKRVLCLGCGTGEECQSILDRGAKEVLGMDVSKGMITEAKKEYPHIDFQIMSMESLNYPDSSFDLVYSSLVLHYIKDWSKPLQEVKRVLKKKGTFLFSTHHPLHWGTNMVMIHGRKSWLMGYINGSEGQPPKIYGDYFKIRKQTDLWFGDFTVRYWHKPLEVILREIRESGMMIEDFVEPQPVPACRTKFPDFWNRTRHIPLFMIFKLRKP